MFCGGIMTLRRLEYRIHDDYHGCFSGFFDDDFPEEAADEYWAIHYALPGTNYTRSPQFRHWFTDKGWRHFGRKLKKIWKGHRKGRLITIQWNGAIEWLDDFQVILPVRQSYRNATIRTI